MRATLAVFILTIMGTLGCATTPTHQVRWLRAGEDAFRARDYAAADRTLSMLLEDCEDRGQIKRALYVRGMARARLNRRPAAYADLKRAVELTSSEPYFGWQPYAVLGVLYFEDGNWALAADAFRSAVSRMPHVPPRDALQFRLGLCYERTGRWAEALDEFGEITEDFPRGQYAGLARQRVARQASQFAVQCGVFRQVANARRLMAELRAGGLQPYLRSERRDGQPIHIVMEGPYQSYERARQGLARVLGYVPKAVLWP
jgi:tetratricopeptide (TPR) repeat protein